MRDKEGADYDIPLIHLIMLFHKDCTRSLLNTRHLSPILSRGSRHSPRPPHSLKQRPLHSGRATACINSGTGSTADMATDRAGENQDVIQPQLHDVGFQCEVKGKD